ncbi:MAG: threonine synthase [Elusimicrobiales bacterium]|nr:threonine synthase [Elusimicrobiales bacterium]HOJ86653.1 threonine synthase [Elusimicrobiales bacterium]HOL62106.1 threonine synthase [Elusimicrobiales bacterium]HPO94693.1 threonine synthase [Elusimicrobiales bacterium]
MKKISMLKCINCGKEHEEEEVKYVCNSCGGNLEVIYDYNLIKKRFNHDELKENRFYDIWRYSDLLPIEDLKDIPPLKIGYTPLYKNKKLADELDISELYIKDDTRNPSASFKDRASAVIVKRVIETLDEDKRIIATASTGNAASSLACISASVGVKNIIFVPETAPLPKITQLLVFGATVIMVKGTYDDAFDLCVKACEHFGWYNRNTGYNPYTREGKKTAAFEICEQLEWEVPDKVFVPVGDGNIISGIWKGFLEFKKIGFIDKLPKLVAVQAENSNAVYKAFEEKLNNIEPVSGETVCDSISVKIPRDGLGALISLRESEGFAVNVSDKEVISAMREFASNTGIFAEPSAAATYAGLKKAISEKKVDKGDSVLILITGSGLKDIETAKKSVPKAYKIQPEMKELEKIMVSINKQG